MVPSTQPGGDLAIVARQRLPGLVSDACRKLVGTSAEQRVTDAHPRLEDRKRQARLSSLQPKAQTAELDRERVEIDPVDCALDDLRKSTLVIRIARLTLSRGARQ